MKQPASPRFVVAWIALGRRRRARPHDRAARLGRTIDLRLPHLQYGYVMFNANPRRVPVFYLRARRRRPPRSRPSSIRDPAFGYASARASRIDAMFTRSTCATCATARCVRATTRSRSTSTAFRVDLERDTPAMTSTVTLRCPALDRLFAPFEGTRDPVRSRSCASRSSPACLLHFAPSLLWLDIGYGRGAVRTDAWNHLAVRAPLAASRRACCARWRWSRSAGLHRGHRRPGARASRRSSRSPAATRSRASTASTSRRSR